MRETLQDLIRALELDDPIDVDTLADYEAVEPDFRSRNATLLDGSPSLVDDPNLLPADPQAAWSKAGTIGAPGVGSHYTTDWRNPDVRDMVAALMGGHRRANTVNAIDPYGIDAWLTKDGPMPGFLGTTGVGGADPVIDAVLAKNDFLKQALRKLPRFRKAVKVATADAKARAAAAINPKDLLKGVHDRLPATVAQDVASYAGDPIHRENLVASFTGDLDATQALQSGLEPLGDVLDVYRAMSPAEAAAYKIGEFDGPRAFTLTEKDARRFMDASRTLLVKGKVPRANVAAVGSVDTAEVLLDPAAVGKWKKLAKAPPEVLNLAKLPANARPAVIVAQTLKGGYSVNPRTGVIPESGVAAGKFPNQSRHTWEVPIKDFNAKVVEAYLHEEAAAFSKQDTKLGAWLYKDKDTGQPISVFLDVSAVDDTVRGATKRAETQVLDSVDQKTTKLVRGPDGKWPQAQKMVYNINTGEETPVGNVYEYLQTPGFRDRADFLLEEGKKAMGDREPWWDITTGPLADTYGVERLRQLSGFLGATSRKTAPVPNMRTATEYMRRLIAHEPILQEHWRMPEDAIGWAKGKKIDSEKTNKPNLLKAATGNIDRMRMDKINDMVHALMGDPNVGVYDRHFAKMVEDWAHGIYADTTSNKVGGAMDSSLGKKAKTSTVGLYAWVDNAMHDGAKRHNMTKSDYTATVWEGIRNEIRTTGQLFGMKYNAAAIPDSVGGFNEIFVELVQEKAEKMGIAVEEMLKRLKSGDATLLTSLLATPVGLMAYRRWTDREQGDAAGPQQ